MFDAVLNRHTKGPARWGRGAIVAATLHGLALGGVILGSLHASHAKANDAPVVTFFAQAPPPPPPPPPPAGGGATHKPKTERKIEKKPNTIVQSKKNEPIPDSPKEEKHADPAGQVGGVEGGVAGGVVGGTVGGTVGGQVGGQLGGTGVVPFGAGMTRPAKPPADMFQYTPQAMAARVEGVNIVKCVITVDGSLQNCRTIKGVPIMDKVILERLSRFHSDPVTIQGHPVAVEYTYTFTLRMPN